MRLGAFYRVPLGILPCASSHFVVCLQPHDNVNMFFSVKDLVVAKIFLNFAFVSMPKPYSRVGWYVI